MGLFNKFVLITVSALFLQTPSSAFAANVLRILNSDGQPIAGASVLIGTEANNPFDGNVFYTDANGNLEIPAQWKMALPITITADGYLTTSFVNLEPRSAQLQLHRSDSRSWMEIKGLTTNYQNVKSDGRVDFSLVIPALSRRDLLQFELSTVLSPETDRIKVLTENVDIPSNMALPEQRESYILPVNLNKPQYRVYVRRPNTYRLTAIQGHFPLKQVINELREGKTLYDVVNLFKFLNGGQRDVLANGNVSGQDIAVNQFRNDAQIEIRAPELPEEHVMLSVALNDQNGVYFSSDLKRVAANQQERLITPKSSSSRYVLSMLLKNKKKDKGALPEMEEITSEALAPAAMFNAFYHSFYKLKGDDLSLTEKEEGTALSLTLQEAAAGAKAEFLSLVNAPKVNGRFLELSRPEATKNILPVATYLIYSEVEKPTDKDYGTERRYRLWEVFTPGWPEHVELPAQAFSQTPGRTYRWEVLFLGRAADFTSPSGYFLDSITHVSRNAIDL
jgi:hypothetical protein